MHVEHSMSLSVDTFSSRGHHIYKDIWISICGEQLQYNCEIGNGNVHHLYAVFVVKHETDVVGHLPKQISMPCHKTEQFQNFIFEKYWVFRNFRK